jgi:REP element-mobilizing transposase RayT
MSRRARQAEMEFRTWGGKRDGAGRPVKGRRRGELHLPRAQFHKTRVVHCTLRIVDDVRPLRRPQLYRAIRGAMFVVGRQPDFRITHISLEHDHVHLLIEVDSHEALSRGMQSFQISAAKRINAAFRSKRDGRRRRGKVFADRYHPVFIDSPRQARNAISYVMNNWRRHRLDNGFHTRNWDVDYYSSGPTWRGWRELGDPSFVIDMPPEYEPLPVALPRTWLLAKGYERGGRPISCKEVPGPQPR